MRSRFLLHFTATVRLLAVCWLGVLLWPTLGYAQDHILDKAYWTDTSGSASFEQARVASYTPYVGVLSKGFGPQAQWVRLQIGAVPAGTTDTLVLRIRPVFLDSITLYDPENLVEGTAARVTGDTTSFRSAEFESLDHSFVIPANPSPRTIWLRLTTTSTQLMHVEAFSPRDMLREELNLWLAYSGMLGVLFACLMWVFIAWQQTRDHVNGTFVLRQSIFLVYTACYLGYHRIVLDGVLSAQQQDLFYGWALLLSTTLTFVFEYRLLNEYVLPRWAHLLFRTGLGLSLTVLVLMLLGRRDLALPMNTLLVGLGMSSFFLGSLFIRSRSVHDVSGSERYLLPKRAINAYYGLAVTLLAVSILPGLGLLHGTLLSIYGVLLYGLMSGLFMTTLLIVRSRQMERLRQEVANSLFLSREQLMLETRRRQDQSQLLNMLMHELKTPMSVIDLALKNRVPDDRTQGYVDRALDNMKSILERCVQTDRLVERPFELQRQRFDFDQQLQQWLGDHKSAQGRHQLQADAPAVLESDLQCVQIIVSNLIDNALKYGDPQQPVRLTLLPQAHPDGRGGWCLRVYNMPGPTGWPQTEQVFAKYYRSPAAQRQSGTGLGLFLSHNLALQLGGALSYRPDTSHICFELWLPA